MKTTYIIGAGASKAVWDLPVMDGFLEDCKPELEELGVAPSDLERYVNMRFGSVAEVNLEELLADLENTLSGLGGMWFGSSVHPHRVKADQVRAQLLHVIKKRLGRIDLSLTTGPDLAGYDRVFSSVKQDDTIITFNYDCGIKRYCRQATPPTTQTTTINNMILKSENFLLRRVVNYVSGTDSFGSGCLIKLHGSVDYQTCSNAHCPDQEVVFGPVGEGPISGGLCPTCGASLEALIVPPTITKAFDRFPKLCLMWRAAMNALLYAQTLLVWGFSCPESDHTFAWLLRYLRSAATIGRLPLRRVIVIDPDHADVTRKLMQLLPPDNSIVWEGHRDHSEFPGLN